MTMPSYSIHVALFDFVPVILSAVGLAFLAQGISQKKPELSLWVWLSAVLIPVGGCCKASWKLLIAWGYAAPDALAQLLFILLAPGFMTMAYALYLSGPLISNTHTQAAPTFRLSRWFVYLFMPLSCAGFATMVYPDSRLWFFCLLAFTSCANAALIVHAIRASRNRQLGHALTLCFLYSFAASLAMSGLSRLPDTETSAWIQELVNFSAQATLAFGLWRLSREFIKEKT